MIRRAAPIDRSRPRARGLTSRRIAPVCGLSTTRAAGVPSNCESSDRVRYRHGRGRRLDHRPARRSPCGAPREPRAHPPRLPRRPRRPQTRRREPHPDTPHRHHVRRVLVAPARGHRPHQVCSAPPRRARSGSDDCHTQGLSCGGRSTRMLPTGLDPRRPPYGGRSAPPGRRRASSLTLGGPRRPPTSTPDVP